MADDDEEFVYPPPSKEVTDARLREKLPTLPRVRVLVRGGKDGKPQHTYYAWDGRSLGLRDRMLGKDPSEAMRRYKKYEADRPEGHGRAKRREDHGEEFAALQPWQRAMYHNALSRSKKAGRPFGLTIESFAKLLRRAGGRCELSNIPLDTSASGGPWAASIDRIDSTKGYEYENCRIVCVMANLAMNKWGAEPLYRLAEGLVGGNSLANDAEKPKEKPLKSTA